MRPVTTPEWPDPGLRAAAGVAGLPARARTFGGTLERTRAVARREMLMYFFRLGAILWKEAA